MTPAVGFRQASMMSFGEVERKPCGVGGKRVVRLGYARGAVQSDHAVAGYGGQLLS